MVPHLPTILPRVTGAWALLRHPAAMLTGCRERGETAWRARGRTPGSTLPLFL